jgi:hypothetical protein
MSISLFVYSCIAISLTNTQTNIPLYRRGTYEVRNGVLSKAAVKVR